MKREEEARLRAQILWMMALRVLVVTLFLGSYLFVFQATAPSALIVLTYVLSIAYALLYSRVSPHALALFQLLGDVGLVSALVGLTGGIDSPFVFLYPVVILGASILLPRTGALGVTAACTALYALIGGFQIASQGEAFLVGSGMGRLYVLVFHGAAFWAMAYLGTTLAASLQGLRRALEEKTTDLDHLHAFNEHVARCMSSGLLTTDASGRVRFFNRAAEEITGWSRREALGKSLENLLPLPEIYQIRESPETVSLPWRFEGEIPRKDGKTRVVGITVSTLTGDRPEDRGWIAVFQDLTEIKAMEAEVRKREKMAMLGEMAAGLAHEIRNPLASVSGALQVLQKELTLKGHHARLMEIALREMDRLNTRISQLLTYARPAPPQRRPVDLHALIRDTLYLLRNAEAFHEGIRIEEHLPGTCPIFVDPDQMSQVFWNLALNALEAMPQGGVLRVYTRRPQGPGGPVEIVFQDTGQGIEPALMDRIFVPFFTTKDRGSGLGLPTVHRIVEEHGGRIQVSSQVGQGTAVHILLPEVPVPAAVKG